MIDEHQNRRSCIVDDQLVILEIAKFKTRCPSFLTCSALHRQLPVADFVFYPPPCHHELTGTKLYDYSAIAPVLLYLLHPCSRMASSKDPRFITSVLLMRLGLKPRYGCATYGLCYCGFAWGYEFSRPIERSFGFVRGIFTIFGFLYHFLLIIDYKQ